MTREEVGSLLSLLKPQTGTEEAYVLFSEAEKLAPKTIVEIGVADGGSLLLWSKLLNEDGVLIGIDAHKYIAWDISSTKCKTVFIQGSTYDDSTLTKTTAALSGRHIDFLRIDGGHDYACVKNDFDKYAPLVRSGGLIAFHDYRSSVEVKRFVDSLKRATIINDTGYMFK